MCESTISPIDTHLVYCRGKELTNYFLTHLIITPGIYFHFLLLRSLITNLFFLFIDIVYNLYDQVLYILPEQR